MKYDVVVFYIFISRKPGSVSKATNPTDATNPTNGTSPTNPTNPTHTTNAMVGVFLDISRGKIKVRIENKKTLQSPLMRALRRIRNT